MEDIADGIPEDLRCKRSDGKQWRCNALSMPDKTVCEKHYYQAKKRAANSALRASLKKAKKNYPYDDADAYLDGKGDDLHAPRSRSISPVNGGSRSMMQAERHTMQAEENRANSQFNPSLRAEAEDYTGQSSSESEAEGLTCHQCRRNDRANVVWCNSCDQKGYCDSCIARWYADIPIEDIQKMCPACCGICNCRVCYNADILIKAKVQEIAPIDKLQYLHSLLSFMLPVLKQIYDEQRFEIGVETTVHGIKAEVPRAKINVDEQMCCDLCKIPIFDYHRHCTNCLFDLCLGCCHELRRASIVALNGDKGESRAPERSRPGSSAAMSQESSEKGSDNCEIEFSRLFPKWRASNDGSIPCGPEEAGGCGSSRLILRRILKINWAAKLVKNAEEMVSGCKVSDMNTTERCGFCTGSSSSHESGPSEWNSLECSQRDGSDDNFLYYPASQDIKQEGTRHFHKHWVRGEPVIVKHVFDRSLASSWDLISILGGIQATLDGKMREDDVILKAINCSNQLEVDVNLDQLIEGYSDRGMHESGWSRMWKLKDCPPSSALEEFISCQRPEFLTNFPLVEFIHFKWGVLNLAAKLPHDTLQTDVGPKLLVAYGTHEELGRGDSFANLQINMCDLGYLLMHTADVDSRGRQWPRTEKNDADKKGLDSLYSGGKDLMNAPEKGHGGAIWDVFRRQDVPKLNEYLRLHSEELTDSAGRPVNSVMYPVYDQAFFLNKDHRRKLKEELRIEPWSFEQHIGEAVFIPAGCPFQVRKLQPSVQLSLDFLSPESLGESARMAREVRSLSNDHGMKLKMLEVGKMSLYAASSAIREIQKIALDPKVDSDIGFEDRNLTSMVSENLERITKPRQIACT